MNLDRPSQRLRWTRLSLLVVLLGCAPAQPPAPTGSGQAAAPSSQSALNAESFAEQVLTVHNRARAAAGVPPLQWDPALAAGALAYGPQLAAAGTLVHSPRSIRPGVSENLWMGTAGRYAPAAMVGSWVEERSAFRAGNFPNVSSTGNWLDVSHYTTMIWRSTTRVGCALHRARQWDFLICRYSPKGNIDGQRVP